MKSSGKMDPGNVLLLAQIDNVPGDSLAHVIDCLIKEGAHNVNLIPSLTKKGRPGYLLLIDAPRLNQSHMERLLVGELGVLGWHVLPSQHFHLEMGAVEREVRFSARGRELSLKVPLKTARSADGTLITSVDHDFCVGARRVLADELGVDVPLRELKNRIQSTLSQAESITSIELL